MGLASFNRMRKLQADKKAIKTKKTAEKDAVEAPATEPKKTTSKKK